MAGYEFLVKVYQHEVFRNLDVGVLTQDFGAGNSAVVQLAWLRAGFPDAASVVGLGEGAALAVLIGWTNAVLVCVGVHSPNFFCSQSQHVQAAAMPATFAVGIAVSAVKNERFVCCLGVCVQLHALPVCACRSCLSSIIAFGRRVGHVYNGSGMIARKASCILGFLGYLVGVPFLGHLENFDAVRF